MEQNQTDYFSLTQIRACNLQALFFFERIFYKLYYGEETTTIWRYYYV